MFDTLPYDLYHSYRGIEKEDYDFIHNRGIIKMTDLTGKRVRINDTCPYEDCRGLKGNVEEKVDWAEDRWHVTVAVAGKSVSFFLKGGWLNTTKEGGMENNRDMVEMTIEDILGKRVVLHDHVGMEYDEMGISDPRGKVVSASYDSRCGYTAVIFNDGRDFQIESLEDVEIIDEEENTKDFLGEEVVVDGKKGLVLEENGDTLYVEFGWDTDDAGYFLKSQVALLAEENIEEPMKGIVKDSLTELQKLCTPNNIHILISKNDYQIWDECSDDTYEMNNVDDVMKAIKCLNELKKWRQ